MDRGKAPIVNMGGDSSNETVKVAVVQASTIFYDTDATIKKAETLLKLAASEGAQLVVFPEAFIGGYPHGSYFGVSTGNRTPKEKEDLRKYCASAIEVPGPEVESLRAMAGEYKVYLVMGVIEIDGDTLYSTVLFFNSLGQYLGKHQNIMPTPLERIIWGYGDGSTIPVFDTPIGKIGAAISRENKMPLLRTAMYTKGIEIYCAPTAARVNRRPANGVWRDVWQEYMTHTAMEGGCFVLSASQFCGIKDRPLPREHVSSGNLNPDFVVCNGGSAIISPLGVVLKGPNYDGEIVLSAILDRREIAKAKLDFDVVGNHARPEVLSLIVRDRPLSPVSFASDTKRKRTEEDHTGQENED